MEKIEDEVVPVSEIAGFGMNRRTILAAGAGATALAAAQGLSQSAVAQGTAKRPSGVKGDPRPVMRLPNGAKIVFTVVIAFEDDKPSNAETINGRPALLARQYRQYGYDYGFWRIMETLDRYGIKASFSTSGLAAQKNPHCIRAMIENGHESYCHGWAQGAVPGDNEIELERQQVRNTIKAIEDGGGVRPVGWAGPGSRSSANTLGLIAEQGLMWHGDDASSDLPFLKDVGGKTLVVLPRVNFPSNDLILIEQAQNPVNVLFDSFKEFFDTLYDEAQRGRPQWAEFLLHADVGGHPALKHPFRQALEYVKGFEGIWQPQRRQLAEWILKNPPRVV